MVGRAPSHFLRAVEALNLAAGRVGPRWPSWPTRRVLREQDQRARCPGTVRASHNGWPAVSRRRAAPHRQRPDGESSTVIEAVDDLDLGGVGERPVGGSIASTRRRRRSSRPPSRRFGGIGNDEPARRALSRSSTPNTASHPPGAVGPANSGSLPDQHRSRRRRAPCARRRSGPPVPLTCGSRPRGRSRARLQTGLALQLVPAAPLIERVTADPVTTTEPRHVQQGEIRLGDQTTNRHRDFPCGHDQRSQPTPQLSGMSRDTCRRSPARTHGGYTPPADASLVVGGYRP